MRFRQLKWSNMIKAKSKLIALSLAMLVMFACFSKRQQQEKDSESVGETTNQAVNPLMDGDDDVEESRLALQEERENTDLVAMIATTQYTGLEMAKLALQKSNSVSIKEIAREVENDHRQSFGKLKKIAGEKDISLPEGVGDIGLMKVKDLKEIKDADEFNEEWLDEMAELQNKMIALLKDHEEIIGNTGLEAWAGKALPAIEKHLAEIEALKRKTEG